MNSLREQIGSAVHDARHGMAIDETTERIIALVREAMLSDDAVVRAVRLALFSMDMGDATEVDAQITVAAALDAAGLTEQAAGEEGE